jgi:hypothetical protein
MSLSKLSQTAPLYIQLWSLLLKIENSLIDRHDIAEIVLKVALNTKNQSNTRAEGSDMIFSHTTDHGKANGKLLSLAAAGRVHPLYNLQSRARTHVVLVIGLYEYEEEEEYFIDQLRTLENGVS